jgi:hypothetical protein
MIYAILVMKVHSELSKTTFRERSQMSKYYCFADAKKSIASKGLTSRLEYVKYLRQNNITHLPDHLVGPHPLRVELVYSSEITHIH